MYSVGILRIVLGRAFHKRGTAHEKARSPWELLLLRGTTRRFLSADQSWRDGSWGFNNLAKYDGPWPWMTRYANSNSLYCMRCLIGSQCRLRSTGVMCSCFFVLVMSRAAAFWTRWSLANKYSEIPYSNAFPLSSLDVMKASTNISVDLLFRRWRILPIEKMWK